MKSILKILVLGVVPILAATAVVDQGLASGKGSQLIFQADVDDKNFISVTNTGSKKAVTVLTQYYNDEMTLVLWYLRVITSGATVLVDPFDHEIPGTAKKDKDGKEMPGTATNVSEVLSALPAMTNEDDGPGVNSGRMVIAVTAVGANVNVDVDGTDTQNAAATVNVLFPDFLAKGMHKTDNIDECGAIKVGSDDSSVAYTPWPANDTDGTDDCKDEDTSSKNVGKLTGANAAAIAFNHLSGHYTSAMVQTAAGGSDQTASWGGMPVVRGAVNNTANAIMIPRDYVTLTGRDSADTGATSAAGGRLEEVDAGGTEHIDTNTAANYTGTKSNLNGPRPTRGLNGGSLTLPALHGGGAETHQVIQLLSVSENFGAGKYMLIPAKTAYKVTLMDNMGDALPDPAADAGPVYGIVDNPKDPPGVSIIVDGIQVMMNAKFAKCTGDMITGDWSVAELVSIVPTAASGKDDFAGLDAMLMPAVNASPGWAVFTRPTTDDDDEGALECKNDLGDGDIATGTLFEDADGVPTKDERTYTAGTLVVEAEAVAIVNEVGYPDRAYVTTGQVVLKFVTAESTFAASWPLNAAPAASPAN